MTADELVARLLQRFKGVPGFTNEDAIELINEAMIEHGYKPTDSVPQLSYKLVLYYAQMQGARQVAFSVAHYFKFSDGEESVDKSMVADNYRKLARDIQLDYDLEWGRIHGNNFRIMPRIDRPNTTPPTGESGRIRWRR